jgi:hypothetical protein
MQCKNAVLHKLREVCPQGCPHPRLTAGEFRVMWPWNRQAAKFAFLQNFLVD